MWHNENFPQSTHKKIKIKNTWPFQVVSSCMASWKFCDQKTFLHCVSCFGSYSTEIFEMLVCTERATAIHCISLYWVWKMDGWMGDKEEENTWLVSQLPSNTLWCGAFFHLNTFNKAVITMTKAVTIVTKIVLPWLWLLVPWLRLYLLSNKS